MTVKQMIRELKQFDGDQVVVLYVILEGHRPVTRIFPLGVPGGPVKISAEPLK